MKNNLLYDRLEQISERLLERIFLCEDLWESQIATACWLLHRWFLQAKCVFLSKYGCLCIHCSNMLIALVLVYATDCWAFRNQRNVARIMLETFTQGKCLFWRYSSNKRNGRINQWYTFYDHVWKWEGCTYSYGSNSAWAMGTSSACMDCCGLILVFGFWFQPFVVISERFALHSNWMLLSISMN